MNQNYAKALTFDGDTFSEIKNNLNFVLQRLVSNIVGTGANDGQLTLKLDVSFCKNTSRTMMPRLMPLSVKSVCRSSNTKSCLTSKLTTSAPAMSATIPWSCSSTQKPASTKCAPSPILPSAVCSMMIWPMPVSAMLPLKLCLNTLMTTSTRTASKFSPH